MKLIKCPYCGKNMSYFSALIGKNSSVYKCRGCMKTSNVYIVKNLFKIYLIFAVIAIVSVVLFLNFGNTGSLQGLWFAIVPFVLFYAICPLFVRLKPMQIYADIVKQESPKTDTVQKNPAQIGDTRVVPQIDDVKEYTENLDMTNEIDTRNIKDAINRKKSEDKTEQNEMDEFFYSYKKQP